MTTDVSLQCARAAVGFAALTMGHVATELERIGQLPDDAAWQQATQAISQWLREQYSDELIEQAKASLGDAAAESDSDDEQAAQAAQAASATTLSLLLTHCVSADVAEQLGDSVTAAMTASWQDAYGDSAEGEDA
ncbi:hypothetical protein [Zymobacter sp. IVIA_5232.4 C2]|uniref:hypothetical protein n=1 Tax=Zymobacter sp. IVIA_5232.4 C2 TaxID=3394855 RepID=UPI0039C1C0ED